MKHPIRNRIAVFLLFAAFFHLVPAFGAETYVSLDRSIAKKCGITFKHPKRWNFFYVEPEQPDELCIIAYRDLSRKKEVSDRPVLQGWKEFADNGLYVKKIPVNERLAEFHFRKNENGDVEYVGEPLTEMATQDGYTPDTIDGMHTVKRGTGTLYVGYAHSTKTKVVNGAVTITKRLKTVDLLFGDDSVSIGERSVVSDKSGKLLRNYNTIFENIFRSMKLVPQPE